MPVIRSIGDSRHKIRDFGTCLKFDGVDGIVTESLFDTFTTTTPATISFWAKLDRAPTNSFESQPIIITKYFYIHARLVTAGKHSFFIRFDEAQARQTGGDVAPTLEWNHFTFIYNPTGGTNVTLTAYVNGNQANSDDYTALPTSAKTAGIGKSGSTYFKGQLDEIKVWNRILSEDEVIDNYLGMDVDTTNLVTYYKADEGEGESLADSSAQGNTGTIAGGITYVTDPPMGIQNRAPVGSTRLSARDTGKGLSLSGTNTFLTLPITLAASGFNIGFWLYNDVKQAQFTKYLGCGSDTTGIYLMNSSNSKNILNLKNSDDGGTTNMVGVQALDVGMWYHVVITHHPDNANIYINGVLDKNVTTASMAETTADLLIGKYYGGGNTRIKMAELVVHNSPAAWTQAQINDLCYLGVVPAGADGLYFFNDNVLDSSGNANNGTLTGGSYTTMVPSTTRTAV